MNPLSLQSRSNRRLLHAAACALGLLALVGLAAPLLSGSPVEPETKTKTKTQPVYLAYTVNNIGYLLTCG